MGLTDMKQSIGKTMFFSKISPYPLKLVTIGVLFHQATIEASFDNNALTSIRAQMLPSWQK